MATRSHGQTRHRLLGPLNERIGDSVYTQNFTTASGSSLHGDVYNKCLEHEGEPEELFCFHHNLMVCVVCRRLYHGKCETVPPITDASENFWNSSMVESCKKNTNLLLKQYKSVAKERGRDIKNIDAKRNDIIKSVKHMKDKVISRIEKMADNVIADLQKLYEVEKSEIVTHLSTLNENIFTLEANNALVVEARKEKRDVGLFVTVHNLIDKQQKMAKVLERIHNDAHKVVLKFQANEKVESIFENVKSFGDIQLKTKEYDVIPRPQRMLKLNNNKTSRSSPEEFKIRKPVSDRKAFHLENVNIRDTEDEETCWVTGMAVLRDSSLLVADNNNKNVKLFGPNNSLLNTVALSSAPFDIGLLNQEQAVISLPDSKQLQFMKIIGKSNMALDETRDLDFDCNAVNVFKDNIIVTSIAEKSVKCLNLQGDVLWTVGIDKKYRGLFEWPWYLQANTASSEIFVSDRQKNTITILTDNGEVVSVRDVHGKGPRGLTMDDIGNMFIVFYMTDQLEIVSTYSPRDRRNLLTKLDGIKHPQSVAYNVETGQLLVSSYNCDYVSIYQIK
ncbi:hypothetical protein ACF0H5_005883 [Mactra antiquata]